jgi:hypothetical protein
MNIDVCSATTNVDVTSGFAGSAGFKVDLSRGDHVGRVSSEWFSRPHDERYLSLPELYAAVHGRNWRPLDMWKAAPSASKLNEMTPSGSSSSCLAGKPRSFPPIGASANFVAWSARRRATLRDLPAPLAGVNLQHGLLSHRAELIKTLEAEDGRVELRAVTGPYYGRIWDHELVAAVMKIAGNGAGDPRWIAPGVLDRATMTHNPFVDVTKDTTTLYASDRDVFLYLVDDTHPIEAGRLPNGYPDLYFRGVYCWNSEVGSKALGIASFYLRAVCMNRNLWGVEGFEEISSVSIIDVIATTLFAATASVRLLVLKARIRIIVAKAERSSHSHSVDHMPSPPDRAVITTTPDDPIIDVRRSPNVRLTCWITIDKSGANTAAIESYNAEQGADIEIRRRKYLNKPVEQDHRAIKRVARPALGFKSFRSAAATLAGVELMHMLRNGQLRTTSKLRPANQFHALAA